MYTLGFTECGKTKDQSLHRVTGPATVVDDDKHSGPGRYDSMSGPTFVSDGNRAAHVVMTVEDYLNIAGRQHSIVDLLSVPGTSEIDFDPPRLETDLYRKSELS